MSAINFTLPASSGQQNTQFSPELFFQTLYYGVTEGSIVICRKSASFAGFERLAIFDLATPGNLDAVVRFAASTPDCYYKFNPVDGNSVVARNAFAIGTKKEVRVITALALDIDCSAKNPKYKSLADAMQILNSLPTPPSAIVGSDGFAGGLHAYWFTEPITITDEATYNEVRAISNRFYRNLKALFAPAELDATSGPERLLRPPGSARLSGNVVSVLHLPRWRYRLDQLTLPPDPNEQPAPAEFEQTQDSVIAEYLGYAGLNVEDLCTALGWTARKHEPDIYDRPEASTSAPTARLYCSADGRPGLTIKTPGSIKVLACDPVTGERLAVNVLDAPTWYSREKFYVLITQGGTSYDDFVECAKRCRTGLPRGTELDVVDPNDPSILAALASLSPSAKPSGPKPVTHSAPKIDKTLFHRPGLIDEMMEKCMAESAFPNRTIAFAGALAAMTSLTARQIRYENLYPNLYIITLGNPGIGKESIRRLCGSVFQEGAISHILASNVASGEGLQDLVFTQNTAPVVQLVIDEFDRVLSQIGDGDERLQSMLVSELLTLFSIGSSPYTIRAKAGAKSASLPIVGPHVSLLGMCTPKEFNLKLRPRMITNGFLPRCLIVEADARSMPHAFSATAWTAQASATIKLWSQATLMNVANASQATQVLVSPDAKLRMDQYIDHTVAQYSKFETSKNDEGMALWSRSGEMAKKLAMLSAASKFHSAPYYVPVEVEDAEWACALAEQQTRHLLYRAEHELTSSPEVLLAQRILAFIKGSKDEILRSDLLRHFRQENASTIDPAVARLIDEQAIYIDRTKTAGRDRCVYKAW